MNFKAFLKEEMIPIFRGESVYNKGGNYWSLDKEWARQFTQSGRDFEIKTAQIDLSSVYIKNPLPHATNEEEFDKAIEEAKKLNFFAVMFDEGIGEPNSIFVINKIVLNKQI